jgi:carboxyl-terminal processing protease
VIAPIDDTPAARAGIRAGDLIIKIDDKFTRGMALGDAIKLMRGKPKTPITLTLVRKGENAPLEVRLIRDVIRVQSVKAKAIEPGYAFVRITQFQERTVDDLAKQLSDLYKQAPLKGIVLDLRNDPGGLLHAAVGVSAVFLAPDSTVVTTEGRTEDAHRRYAASPSDYQRTHGDDALAHLPPQIKSVPLVVLVNGASASASEIVAGALQDHKRATLIGTQTFGKGSVQTIIPIRNDRDNPTAIKLTTARYYTPSGRSIQAQGITPDLLVDDTAEGNFAGLNVREADLAHHLENQNAVGAGLEQTKGTDQTNAAGGDKDEAMNAPHPIAPPHRYEFGSADDFQLKQAMNYLQGRPVDTVKAKESVAASPAPAR